MAIDICFLCGRPVTLAISLAGGAPIAFDPASVKDGDFVLWEEHGRRLCRQVRQVLAGYSYHRPHRRSCPARAAVAPLAAAAAVLAIALALESPFSLLFAGEALAACWWAERCEAAIGRALWPLMPAARTR